MIPEMLDVCHGVRFQSSLEDKSGGLNQKFEGLLMRAF